MKRIAVTSLACVAGGALAVLATAALTLLISFAICLGANPEAAMAAEWAAIAAGLVWVGAIARRFGLAASLGSGTVVGLVWALAWLYLMGRFDPRLWATEALRELTWRHVAAWAAAPALATLGGLLAARLRKAKGAARAAFHAAAPTFVIIVVLVNCALVEAPGTHTLAKGVTLTSRAPDPEGTITRLLTFDFTANPRLRIAVDDRDSDDSRPFDDTNTTYLGIPALSVFERDPKTLCVVNAGFFGWSDTGRIGMHVAPLVLNGRAYYNKLGGPDMWTFGWTHVSGLNSRNTGGQPRFDLIKGIAFARLESQFDTAIGHVRPLIVNGKSLKLEPGAGVTLLRCSRTSLGWSDGSSKLHLLVVRDPDGERSSIDAWKRDKSDQVGGWDLPRVQRYWAKMGVDHAIALDGGDSTQLVYRSPRGITFTGSARLGMTLGYLRHRPVRFWFPVLPIRHSDLGVMNYLVIKTHH